MKKQRGDAIVAILLVSTLIQLVPLWLQANAKPDPRCWSGFLYDGMNGRQIIGENGGGIRCVVKDEKK